MTYKQDIAWVPHDALDHMLEINRIDSWLRGLCDVTPRRQAAKTDTPLSSAFNGYSLALASERLTLQDIERTVGFQRLLDSCSASNLHLDIKLTEDSRLQVGFQTSKPFSSSRIFDSRQGNVHRASFQRSN